jgi:hypothetical protein
MYSSFDAVGIAVRAATGPGGAITKDREQFSKYFARGEKYIHDENLVVGGAIATKMLLGRPIGYEAAVYFLYCTHARTAARGLVDALHQVDPDGLGQYARTDPVGSGRTFDVMIDGRPLFRIHSLAVHRGAHIVDLIVPTTCPAYFAKDPKGKPLGIPCMGPEIQLIGTYASLSNPSKAGSWPELLEARRLLGAMFAKSVQSKVKKVLSGGGPSIMMRSRDRLVAALLEEYVTRAGRVVVGTYAIDALGGTRSGHPRLQVVAEGGLKDEERLVSKIATRLGFSVQSTHNDPKVPINACLRRMTMYITRDGERRVPFLDVFNAGEYELVPFWTQADAESPVLPVQGGRPHPKGPALSAEVAIGTPFAVLRFILVDMWTILLLHRMDMASSDYANSVLRGMLGNVKSTDLVIARLVNDHKFTTLFPLSVERYIGHHTDPMVEEKRARRKARQEAKAKGRRISRAPYLPAKAP